MNANKTGESRRALPDAELDVMMILWDIGRPALASEIHRELSKRRRSSKTAVHVLLDRLAAKGYVRLDTVDAPVPYKLAVPLIEREEYRSAASESFISKVFAGRWQSLIANLVDSGQISDEDIEEIEQIISGKKRNDD